jgi:hypothetical protein
MRVHERAYAPFLATARRHPFVRFSLHISGGLLEWMIHEAPGTVKIIREMVANAQCEMMAGTYYEALVPVAPEHDVKRSIEAYVRKLNDVFGANAKGIWLAERVYEPHVPRILADVNVRYTALDDWHFRAAGITASRLGRPWLLEHQGATVTVCPISERLRYLVPFAPVDEVIAHLRELHEAGAQMACLADDGEKLGAWPGTYRRCYEEGWLDDFFAALAESSDWLRVTTLGEAVAAVPAAGPAYLPATSYREMTRWALPTASQRRLDDLGPDFAADGVNADLVTGTSFRSFFHKYPEANFFHKRVQEVSQRVEEADEQMGPQAKDIRRHLWRAETNDAYWHGVFGGVYLPHLRRGIRRELVRAEHMLDDYTGASTSEQVGDMDADGVAEITLKNENVVAVLSAKGLAAVEFTRRSPPTVLTDVIARRPEPYHGELKASANNGETVAATIHAPREAKEPGLESYLVYDRRPKRLFLERVFDGRADVGSYAREAAAEFVPFSWGKPIRSAKGWRTVASLRTAEPGRLDVDKEITLTEQGLSSSYVFRSNSPKPLIIGIEFTLNIISESLDYSSLKTPKKYTCDDVFETAAAAEYVLADYLAEWELVFVLEPAFALWHAPIYTVNCSEAGFEKVYQGSSLFFWRRLAQGENGFESSIAMTLR